ncbi:hypothetical protein [Curtobacterium oceanosedimentum]|uniref:hypothetical protein n=1 Tax=Curtobacterium oceanosedimentum TaxID=465820 RepID=UPI001CE17AFE|nr:hypothetical protein [Curtobacterium oceanosedimentum]MCA5924266.1 hypothetical protein [Curtobacterium oceanosedimentum]
MKHIQYDRSSILTTDDVADAVIEYAAALAGGDRADTVSIPAVAADGTMTTTKVLIGPASQLVVEDAEEDELEGEHDQFVARLRAATLTFEHEAAIHADQRTDLVEGDAPDPV